MDVHVGPDSLDLTIILQMTLAIACGGAIGLEREARGRAAGLRTMILVCLGSTLIMVGSGRLVMPYGGTAAEAALRVDPGRIAAGIITGIGFLGAAVVIKLGDLIRGVTTAASIWFVAALGIVIGQELFSLALLATALGLTVLWLFNYLERWIPSPQYRQLHLVTHAAVSSDVLTEARLRLRRHGVRLLDVHSRLETETQRSDLILWIRSLQSLDAHGVVKDLSELDGVQLVDWRS